MKHYVIQELRRCAIMAQSIAEAKRIFRTEHLNLPWEIEECGIVEEESGDEESLL